VWLISRTSTYNASSPCVAQGTCTAGQLADPGMTQASLSVPLIAPQTEFGDRINQLDINLTKQIKVGRFNVQPKLDFFNVLNVASVILNPRTVQIGANIRFSPRSPESPGSPVGLVGPRLPFPPISECATLNLPSQARYVAAQTKAH